MKNKIVIGARIKFVLPVFCLFILLITSLPFTSEALTVSESTYTMPVVTVMGNCDKCHDPSLHEVDNCYTCHDLALYEPAAITRGGHGGLIVTNQSKMKSTAPVGNCQVCHLYKSKYYNLCVNCHPSMWSGWGWYPGPLQPDPNPDWPIGYIHDYTRINNYVGIDNTYNCEKCHIQNWWSNIPKHDITTYGSVYSHQVVINDDCQQCHYESLLTEHAQPGRSDSLQNSITCLTCHSNTNTEIKQAIVSGNKNCDACHLGAINHQEVHSVTLDQGCQNAACHSPDISTEHADRNIDCSVCHESNVSEIIWAVSNGKKDCQACHGLAHDLALVPLVPEDVPMYPNLNWSSPVLLSIWNGEPWIEENQSGYMAVFSERGSFTVEDIWSYYYDHMTEEEWSLVSPNPSPGNSNFKAVYTKGERKIIIWLYDTEVPLAGDTVSSGSRIFIIY